MKIYTNDLVKGHSDFKVKCLTFGLYTQVSDSGPHGPLVFPGQGKVREFCGWPGKFRKDLERKGTVREFENKWLWQAVVRKFIYCVEEGKGCTLL